MDNIEWNMSSFYSTYPCAAELGSYLVHGGYLICSHCQKSITSHLNKFINDVVGLILTDRKVTQPTSDTVEEESLSLARCLSALADTYPGPFQKPLGEW